MLRKLEFGEASRGGLGVLIAGVVSAGCVLAACEDSIQLVVENHCSVAIEADVNDVPDPMSLGHNLAWRLLPPGGSQSLRTDSDHVKRVYVWVRASGSKLVPEPLVIDRSAAVLSSGKWVTAIAGHGMPK